MCILSGDNEERHGCLAGGGVVQGCVREVEQKSLTHLNLLGNVLRHLLSEENALSRCHCVFFLV